MAEGSQESSTLENQSCLHICHLSNKVLSPCIITNVLSHDIMGHSVTSFHASRTNSKRLTVLRLQCPCPRAPASRPLPNRSYPTTSLENPSFHRHPNPSCTHVPTCSHTAQARHPHRPTEPLLPACLQREVQSSRPCSPPLLPARSPHSAYSGPCSADERAPPGKGCPQCTSSGF